MSDDAALEQMQNPQAASQPADNLAVINQFNRADPQKRAVANSFGAGQLKDYDDRLNRLHGIDARLLAGEVAPVDQLDPNILRQAQMAKAAGQLPMAYNLLQEENHKHIARSQYGGAMSPEEWDSLRDYAGRKAAAHAAGAPSSMPTESAPLVTGTPDRSSMLSAAMQSPDAKQALYQSGIDAFDRILGHHKKYLVEYPKMPKKAPVAQGGAPVQLAPHENAIVQLMKKVGTIAEQQQQGAPPVAAQDFAQQIGILPKVTP